MKRLLTTGLAALLFASCGLYTPYSRPAVETDGIYRDTTVSADSATLAAWSWKELFADTCLQILIEQGLEKNTDLRVARLQIAEAEAALMNARLAYLPTLSLAPEAGIGSTAGNVAKTYNLAASTAWELDIFGKKTNAKRIAKAQQEEALLKFRQSLLDAGKEVNNALIQWQTARQRIEIGERQVETLREVVEKTELLVRHTSTTCLEVLTAQQALLSAEQTQAQDRFEEIQAVINLYHALGGGAQ